MTSRLEPCKLVAEGCCNHMGDIDLAFQMTEEAKLRGADFIKWQKRNPKLSVKKEILDGPHPDARHAFGNTYLEHREALEFSISEHELLKKHADKVDIGYAASAWDLESAKEIMHLCDDFMKIPSAANYDLDMIYYLLDNYHGKLHISLGTLGYQQKQKLFVKLLHGFDKIVFYHTTTKYPCDFKDINLKEIKVLAEKFNEVGFSGHHKGLAIDNIAYAYGASWIERHFTLDRTLKGTDHSASLEPRGLEILARDLKASYLANTEKRVVDEEELKNAHKLRTPNSEKYLKD